MDADDQVDVDAMMIELDGTENKARLGANAILGASLAVAKAAGGGGGSAALPLCGGANAHTLPVPMMNIINGGAHADNPVDIQEFMIMPVGAPRASRRPPRGRRGLPRPEGGVLKDAGHNTNVGDEGGFAPDLASTEEALDYIMKSHRGRRLQAGRRRPPGPGRAATEFFADGKYELAGEGRSPRQRRNGRTTWPTWWTAIRSSPSRTAWPRTTGTAGRR